MTVLKRKLMRDLNLLRTFKLTGGGGDFSKKIQKKCFIWKFEKVGSKTPRIRSSWYLVETNIFLASILTPEIGKWSKKAIFKRFLGVLWLQRSNKWQKKFFFGRPPTRKKKFSNFFENLGSKFWILSFTKKSLKMTLNLCNWVQMGGFNPNLIKKIFDKILLHK